MDKLIIDDFLAKEDFDKISNMVMDNVHFPWFYYNGKTVANDDWFQFAHTFYWDNKPNSNYFDALDCFLTKLNVNSLIRIKANLTVRTEHLFLSEMHTDVDFDCRTAIWYLNDNDGYTEFADGERIQSKANRMVIFPSNLKHAGSSHTDTKTRIVFNFNYI